ncbi:unnamed protein product [Haemonchus placei]|uniref:SCP domain-containing protein n=1 Tax=Haemonchus placei TaxID=6290 RepID=A0A158QR93_HAEPC|nr:unnamed protein product [Haemonchus placei]
MNKPLYIRSTGAQGCNSNESCGKQLAGSTCIKEGTYAGLCDPGEKTFAGTPLNMTDAVRQHIIDMHNYRRSRLAQGLVPNGTTGKRLPAGTDIAQLKYNMELERAAQAYANNCPTGLSSVASRPGTGEIYQSLPSNKLAIMDVISRALKASWHPVWIVGFSDTLEFVQRLEETPNAPIMFTQMAWGNTTEVGCGAARCSSNTTVICRYNPRGNTVGQKIYTPGKTCSKCPNGCTTAFLYKGLCLD